MLDGSVVGLVTEVVHVPSQDMLSVTRADTSEVLIPFIGQFVPTVDVVGKRIVIDPPPGLLDELDPEIAE